MHDTWGVSGPWFLAGYLALTLVVLLVVVLARRSIARASGRNGRVDGVAGDPYRLAMLNEGETLTAATVVAELRRIGVVDELSDGDADVFVVGARPRGLDPLEDSVYGVLQESPHSTVESIVDAPAPSAELASLRTSLVADGLLLTDDQRRRTRRHALWVVGLLVLGGARIVAGLANGKPVLFLVMLVGALAIVVLPWSLRPARTTGLGQDILKSARKSSNGLKKDIGSGDPRLGLAIALFGAAVLWNAEPGLAQTLGLPRPGGGGGDGGGGCGGGCGGCGG
jgi:uncharacterized protein (TIGR04222 family)